MREIDCRGLPCPQPVINTKNALEDLDVGEVIAVLVDNEAAVGNVRRFAESQGHSVEVEELEGYWRLLVTKKGASQPVGTITCAYPEGVRPVVVIDREVMGQGDEKLGRILMRAFLKTLKEASVKPEKLIFYNKGVFLTLEDSELLPDLKSLEQSGITILVCGTCLDFYQVKDKLGVGQVSNMYDIMESMLRAGLVVKP